MKFFQIGVVITNQFRTELLDYSFKILILCSMGEGNFAMYFTPMFLKQKKAGACTRGQNQ